ncbi:MAG TPA: prepilin-type N-terminal cleavage/methylation domain-containing protein [Phycisphaerae bacterium]|nr:prepilin-type N-terminal cleavage/methylation domain-containing protein [Phycisphaerae bacterium]
MNGHRHNPTRREAPGARRAFTLAELLVAVAVMTLLMLAVANIFGLVQRSSSLTSANVDVLDKLRTVSSVIRSDIEFMDKTAYLIIRTEDVLSVRDVLDQAAAARTARADRLIFHSNDAQGQRSLTDLTESGSGDASVVYYGHGLGGRIPPGSPCADMAGTVLTEPISEWVLSRRAILLYTQLPGATVCGDVPPLSSNLDLNNLDSMFRQSRLDGIDDSAAGFITNVGNANPLNLSWFWDRSAVPTAVDADTYRRACFLLAEHVGDFIVEWTDGSVVDPGTDLSNPNDDADSRTQWFGRGRDVDLDGNLVAGSGDIVSKTSWLIHWGVPPTDPLRITFENKIEINLADAINSPIPLTYYAIWMPAQLADPDYAPKAIRILIRLYDSQKRLRDSRGNPGQLYTLYFDLP